jgi:predicted acylesterase/phospholipase RssA
VGGFLQDLELLRELQLERLHFGVRRLGLLAMDLPGGEEVFAATGLECPVPPGPLVLGGISIPGLFPLVPVRTPGRVFRLADGGFSHSIPVERAFEPPFLADKVLAVDLQVFRGFREYGRNRWERLMAERGDSLVRLRPAVADVGSIFFRREQAAAVLHAGEESVTDEVLSRLTLSPGGC